MIKLMPFLAKLSHYFCRVGGKTLGRFFFAFSVQGQENLAGLEGPLIIVFNHASWLDPILIQVAIPPNLPIAPVHFAAWQGHYYKPWLWPFMKLAGAFPVRRGEGLEKTLGPGLKILQAGGTVALAPEGKRRHLGRPKKGRRGAAFLTIRTQARVLPVYINNALGLRWSDLFFRKREITLLIGRPFSLPAKDEISLTNENLLNDFSDLIMVMVRYLKIINLQASDGAE